MKTIYKYDIAPEGQCHHLPNGAKVLNVEFQDGSLYLWALVDTSADKVDKRMFYPFATGQPMNIVGTYIGSATRYGEAYHVFETINPSIQTR